MLDYETCMKLKEAGWPQNERSETGIFFWCENNGELGKGREQGIKRIQHRDFLDEWGFTWDKLCDCPTLEELIEGCKDHSPLLTYMKDDDLVMVWAAGAHKALPPNWPKTKERPLKQNIIHCYNYDTPEKAVADLWFELQKETP